MQTVNFDAKDVFNGKSFSIMDSFNNVKIVSNGLSNVYKAIDKVDHEKGDDVVLLDYQQAIVPVILHETAVLLGLTKGEEAKLKELSYSYVQDFYAEACKKFTGIDLPTIERMQENIKRAQAAANGQSLEDDEELTDPK